MIGPAFAAPIAILTQVESLFPLSSDKPDELSFKVGEIISVERDEGEWLFGALFSGQKGWFPKNYTRPYVPGPTEPLSKPKPAVLAHVYLRPE